MCYRLLMRAYVAQVTQSELRRFVPEDALPGDILRHLIAEWTSPVTAAIRAVLGEEDAEAVREELAADRHREACGVLLDRAVEVHPIVPDVAEFGLKSDEEPMGDAAP